jgi:ribosomal protein S18 acetylase RimI-like enzyme
MRLDADENVYVLEVNPNPDITPEDGFPAAVEAAGIGYQEFVRTVVENAMKRREAERKAARATMPRKRASRRHKGPAPRIRRSRQADRQAVISLIERTGFFHDDEVAVAAEVLDDALAAGPHCDYQSFTAEVDGTPAGWVCFGPTPCTVATFDIYWIAVDPEIQGRGVGSALIAHAEALIRKRGGKLSIIETSGRDLYAPTQQFYLRVGYTEAARIPHFYAPDDAKIIYVKQMK